MTAKTIDHRSNSFDFLRLIAAVMVIFSHSYSLKGIDAAEPLGRATSVMSFGNLAVIIFFAISGYLVTLSWLRDPNVGRFLARRLLRLIPALAFVTILACFVIGPLLSTLPVTDYFRTAESWRYLVNILIYPVQYFLPDVFADNPYPGVVNGSIWTLRLEFSFYLIVVALGLTGFLRWRYTGLVLMTLCVVSYTALQSLPSLQGIIAHKQLLLIAMNGVPFFSGLFLAQNYPGKRWPLTWVAAAGVTAIVCLCVHGPAVGIALAFVTFFCIGAAQNVRVDMTRFGDYSYGLYVWGFLVQQILMQWDRSMSLTAFFLTATLISFFPACLSWWLVEKPALRMKFRMAKGMAPTGDAVSAKDVVGSINAAIGVDHA